MSFLLRNFIVIASRRRASGNVFSLSREKGDLRRLSTV